MMNYDEMTTEVEKIITTYLERSRETNSASLQSYYQGCANGAFHLWTMATADNNEASETLIRLLHLVNSRG